MNTRQAEDVLKHTFKQLEKMLKDENKKKGASEKNKPEDPRQPPEQRQEKKSGDTSTTGNSEKERISADQPQESNDAHSRV